MSFKTILKVRPFFVIELTYLYSRHGLEAQGQRNVITPPVRILRDAPMADRHLLVENP